MDDLTEESNDKPKGRNNLQGLMRCITCLPCFPEYSPSPETPNFNQLKKLYIQFKGEDPNRIEVQSIERSKYDELCDWTNKILIYLPNINDAPEGSEGKAQVVTHFNTIKKFYTVVQNAGFDSSEMETLFNSIQIYEAVSSVAFVVFSNHPDTLKSINESLNEAITKIKEHASVGCFTLTFCGLAILSSFNRILGIIDEKLGEMGIPKLAEQFLNLIEVFCKYFNIDLQDGKKLAALSDSIHEMIQSITSHLRPIFGDSIPGTERKKKWGPLEITERIRNKLSKFETQSIIVERTIKSFERFFNTVRSIDDNLENFKLKSSSALQTTNRKMSLTDIDLNDIAVVESRTSFVDDIIAKQESSFEQVKETARLFQHIETILSYGVLIFKNEDDILNPLLDYVDECTKILEKYAALHPLYKILLGKNYLSNLKVVAKKMIDLLKNSKLIVNSPKEFLNELKQKYPNLIYILCESFLNDKLKQKLEFLPDGLENAINNSMDKALSRFKDKFKI